MKGTFGIYPYDGISPNSSQNEKCFRQTYRENQNTSCLFHNFFPKSYRLCDNVTKYGTAGQVTVDDIYIYEACDLHAEYLKL